MKRRAGFTLIELLITLTVMVILVILAVITVRSTQATARDEKRKTDIENIARGLELRYVNGNPKATSPWVYKGAYPGTNEILHALGEDRSSQDFVPAQITGGYITELLPDTSAENFVPPGGGTFYPSCVWACQPAETQSFIESISTPGKYIYEPIDADGNICPGKECVRFNLYYRTEVDNVIHKVKSKRQ